jgi:hypothetical protein
VIGLAYRHWGGGSVALGDLWVSDAYFKIKAWVSKILIAVIITLAWIIYVRDFLAG